MPLSSHCVHAYAVSNCHMYTYIVCPVAVVALTLLRFDGTVDAGC